jgi:predicted Zn-dependent protease
MQRVLATLALLLALVGAGGCTVNPATGQQSFTAFMSPEDERRVGAREHPKLVRAFGGTYGDQALTAYVEQVGRKLAQTTELPEGPYAFTVLDDETPNAFALPGGYVHVSRGLLALADNEAEMAGVLGHELGHITARHIAQRYSQGQVAGLGVGLLGIAGAILGVPGIATDVAAYGAQAYLQGYSRDQERESDALGIRYMTRAGYDAEGMVSFFRKLDAFVRVKAAMAGDPDAADRFDIMASHPRTTERIQLASQVARTTGEGGAVERDRYLARIDGMIFGDSPEQGVRRGRDFAHPKLRIAFRAPPGFAMSNDPERVTARGPNGAAMIFDSERRQDVAQGARSMAVYVANVWGAKLPLGRVDSFQVNGMDAAAGRAQVKSRNGDPLDLTLAAVHESRDRIYRFLFIAPPQATRALLPEFQRTVDSFRRLSAAEAGAIKPYRIRVVTVGQGDTVETLARRMPFESQRVEMFRAINGLEPGEPVRPGRKVKIIAD